MKRKSLLFALLLAIGLPWAANAQETFTVYENETGTSEYVPFQGYNADAAQHNQMIYPAEDLSDMEDGTITQMVFHISSWGSSGSTQGNWTVSIGETTATSLSGLDNTTSLTQVYSGQMVYNEDHTTMTITFEEGYEYQGGNLLVDFNHSAAGWRRIYFYGKTVTGASYTYGSQRNFLPRITFTYTSGQTSSCPKPTITGVVEGTDYVSLQWTKDGDVTQWQAECSQNADFTNAATLNVSNGLPYGRFDDLTPGTTYYVHVRSYCGGTDYSNWSNRVSFITECEAVTAFPWSEDFEDYATGRFSDPCWVNEHISGGGTSVFQVSTSNNQTGSTHTLQLPDMSDGTMTKLRLPKMTLTTNDDYVFSIDVYRNASTTNYGEGIRVFASRDGEIEGATELAFISRSYTTSDGNLIPAEASSGWYSYELPIPFTGTCYIVLRGESKFGSSTYMDNFKVKKVLPCVKPSAPTFVSATTNSAILSWTNGADTQNAWQIAYSTNSSFNPDDVTPVDVTSNPDTITGLTTATTYYAYVRANCGDLGYSEWSTTYCSFTTACEAHTITDAEPYSENFNSYNSTASTLTPSDYPYDELPLCWSFLNRSENSSIYPQVFLSSNSTYAVSGNCLFFKSSNSTPIYAILPELTNDISTLQLTFTYKNEGTGTNNGTLYVGYMTDPTDASTFQVKYTCAQTTTLTTPDPVYFADAPAGSYIAFRYTGGTSNNYYLSIDNVEVAITPTCWQPQNLTASNVTNEAATFTWERHAMGTETSWVLQYGTDETFATYIDQVTVNTDPTYTIESGLTASTTYYVRVKPACDTEGLLWSEVINFTTEVDCAAPTGLAVTAGSETVDGATITWNGRNDSYMVEYRKVITPAVELDETYGFEDQTMQGWTTINNDGDDYTWSITNGSAHTGSYIVRSHYTPNGVTPDDWLISPEIPLGGTFSFYARRYGTSYTDQFQVYVSTTGKNISDFTPISDVITPAATYDLYEYDLSTYNSESGYGYVAIQYVGLANQYYVFVDDIHITGFIAGEYEAWQPVNDPTPTSPYTFDNLDDNTTYEVRVKGFCGNDASDYSDVVSFTTLDACPAPSNLTVGTITHNAATISWNGGLATEWKVWIKESTATDYPATYSTVTTATKSFENLTATTTYDVKIAPTCNETKYLEVMEAFTTPCAPITSFPWNEGFEDGELSGCWSQDGDSEWTVGTGDGNTSTSIDAHTGTYNAKIIHSVSGNITKLITPMLDLTSLNHPMLTFWYVNRNWSNDIDDLAVYYRAASDAAWIQIDATEEVHTTWTKAAYMLPNPSATYQIAFEMTDDYGYGVGIDDITIEEAPFYTLTIEGYENYTGEGNGGYYLIASPVTVDLTNHAMTTGYFDLYAFDQAQDDEWRNYKQNAFNLEPGKGYLYAHKTGGEFILTGVPYSGNGEVTLHKTEGGDFPGWNLVGNPFGEIAYIQGGRDFYTMLATGDDLELVTNGSIQPLEGIFVIADTDGETMTFTTEDSGSKGSLLSINLSDGSNLIDRVAVRFGEGRTLPKFQLNPNHTKIYFPMDDNNYAVVRSNRSGRLPINFEPAEKGTYTISVNTENVQVRYLHLIDHETGIDTDLLRFPTYRFDAKLNEKPKRFELVYRTGSDLYKELFVKGGNSESFGFCNNGDWVINNDGKAIIQVIDVNGHILINEEINGRYSMHMNVVPGVYMLRLINGNDVKVQKVVVE